MAWQSWTDNTTSTSTVSWGTTNDYGNVVVIGGGLGSAPKQPSEIDWLKGRVREICELVKI